MISFCRLYNKAMLSMFPKHEKVSSVNIVTGTIGLVASFLYLILRFITAPIIDIAKYIWMIIPIDMPDMNKHIDEEYLLPTALFALVDVFSAWALITVGLWYTAIIITYILTIVTISFLLDFLRMKKEGEWVATYFIIKPYNFLAGITTSHCDLKK